MQPIQSSWLPKSTHFHQASSAKWWYSTEGLKKRWLHVCDQFGVAENLSVDVLFDISFVDHYIRRVFQGKREIVPGNLRPESISFLFSTVSWFSSKIYVLNVQLFPLVKSNDVGNDKQEKEVIIYRGSRRIKISPFMQPPVRVRCYEQALPLVEGHPSAVKRRCYMAPVVS